LGFWLFRDLVFLSNSWGEGVFSFLIVEIVTGFLRIGGCFVLLLRDWFLGCSWFFAGTKEFWRD
jgi:hypothetical protein